MKKKSICILAVILVCLVGSVNVPAAGAGRGHHGNGSGRASGYRTEQNQNFADEDGDGICDHYSSNPGQNFADEDGDGICDHYSNPGNGVCDSTCGSVRKPFSKGSRPKNGTGRRCMASF